MKTPTIKDIRTAAAARRTQRVKRKRLAVWLTLVVVVGMGLGGVVLPRVVESQVKTRLEAALARPVEVGAVETNLSSLTVTISDGQVMNPDGGLLVKWSRLQVNLRAMALVRGRAGFDAIELDGFEGKVAIDAEGRLNFADLLPGETDTGDEAKRQRLDWEIGRLEVRDAKLDFFDASKAMPFKTSFGPMTFSLRDFQSSGDPKAPYNFVAVTEAGEKIEWGGTLSLSPLRSQGQVALTDFQIKKYAPYYEDALKFTIGDGRVSATGEYEWVTAAEGPKFALKGGTMELAEVVLKHDSRAKPSITVDQVAVKGIAFDSVAAALYLDQVEWTGGEVALERDAAGLDLARWFESETESPESSKLVVKVGRLAIAEVRGAWRDRTNPRLVEWGISGMNLSVSDIDLSDQAAAVSLAMDLSFEGGGRVSMTGETGLNPFRPALKLHAQSLALNRLSPYLESGLGARFTQGAFSVEGNVGMVGDGVVFQGEAAASAVRLATMANEEIAGWEDLRVGGLSYTSNPTTWTIESVRWIRPEGRMQVRRDGSLNWTNTETTNSAPSGTEINALNLAGAGGEPQSAETVVRVDRVELVEAQVAFSDESLPRKAEMTLTGLSGTLKGLSSLQGGKGEAVLNGMIDGKAPVAISGDFNPLGTPAYTNLKMKFERVDLRALGGYVSKYAGYQLDRGRLSLEVDFKLENRIIQSAAVATLDGFELGDKFSSPDATKLPVKLAIALLKDASGQIVIDLPVEGDLDDPSFRYSRVVERVLTNLLKKAATAPFALLGLTGGDSGERGERLDTVDFAAGAITVGQAEVEKLSRIAEALADRPELNLEIKGGYDTASDREALGPILLERDLRRGVGLPVDLIEPWAENQRKAALVQRYSQVFGRPPIDPHGPVLPAPSEPVAPAETPPGVEAKSVAGEATFLDWLKGVLSGNAAKPLPKKEAVIAPDPTPDSFVQPELPALPAAVIYAELLARREVSNGELAALATGRAQAVKTFMIGRGIAESRLMLSPEQIETAQVKLSLR